MTATAGNLEMLARALTQGYTIGPRSSCAGCGAKLQDFDAKCNGLCETCAATIEALKEPRK